MLLENDINKLTFSSTVFQNKSDSDNEYAIMCHQLIAEISELCTISLHVSLTYQRKKTALDMFCALVKTMTSKDVNARAVVTVKTCFSLVCFNRHRRKHMYVVSVLTDQVEPY